MTPLRRRRLLTLAALPANHKRFYPQYLTLLYEGLVGWTIGSAWLTNLGRAELERLCSGDSQ